MTESRQQHWETVYTTRPADAVSWYQPHADQSLQLIRDSGLPSSASLIDIGGGASTLVDDLLRLGYSSLTVLDVSTAALAIARGRLGPERSARVQWLEADITETSLPRHAHDLWHDRAVFHFLTGAADRKHYVRTMNEALRPGGHLIVATFAEDGPERCSGLPVARYSAQTLQAAFGPRFELIAQAREAHRTPAGASQSFLYCHFRKQEQP